MPLIYLQGDKVRLYTDTQATFSSGITLNSLLPVKARALATKRDKASK